MTSEHSRELHQIDPGEDLPSDAECLAEAKDLLAHLEAGDLSYVPPWMTLDECLEDARQQVSRYQKSAESS